MIEEKGAQVPTASRKTIGRHHLESNINEQLPSTVMEMLMRGWKVLATLTFTSHRLNNHPSHSVQPCTSIPPYPLHNASSTIFISLPWFHVPDKRLPLIKRTPRPFREAINHPTLDLIMFEQARNRHLWSGRIEPVSQLKAVRVLLAPKAVPTPWNTLGKPCKHALVLQKKHVGISSVKTDADSGHSARSYLQVPSWTEY